MSFEGVDRICPHFVDLLQVAAEHIGMLIIFGGDVLLDCFGHGHCMRSAKRQEEDVAGADQYLLRKPIRYTYDVILPSPMQ